MKKCRIAISTIISVLLCVFCISCSSESPVLKDSAEKMKIASQTQEDVHDDDSVTEQGFQGPQPELDENGNLVPVEGQEGIEIYTYKTSPVPIVRGEPVEFILPTGETHWYEAVHLPEQGLNWLQAKELAKEAGGYLATTHSREENEFVFSLIDEKKYWFTLPANFNHVMCGPFIGAFQPIGSEEPLGGWKWVTDEPWTFSNWCNDGVPGDRDPRDNIQPNNSGGNRQQNTVAYGEVNERVSYWSDLHVDLAGTHGFIIEYDKKP